MGKAADALTEVRRERADLEWRQRLWPSSSPSEDHEKLAAMDRRIGELEVAVRDEQAAELAKAKQRAEQEAERTEAKRRKEELIGRWGAELYPKAPKVSADSPTLNRA